MKQINQTINQRTNKDFENKAKQALDQKANTLNDQVLQRLQNARNTALSQKPNKTSLPQLNLKWITGAGAGLALAGLLSFMIIPGLISDKKQANTVAIFEDFEMLNDESELDLYTQLDFYQWLDESINEASL